MLVTHRPAAALAPYVETMWFVSRDALPHSRERALPTGRVDIVIPVLQDSVVRFDSVDSVQARHLRGAVVSGAHDRFLVRAPTDQFYGERSCRLRDPFGHTWLIGHEIEKLQPEEMQRRFSALFG